MCVYVCMCVYMCVYVYAFVCSVESTSLFSPILMIPPAKWTASLQYILTYARTST